MKILVRALVGLSIFPAGFMCLMSFMMLDAPGSGGPITLFMIASIWSYPLLVIVGLIKSAENFRWIALPLLSPALCFVGALLLEAVCGGKFTC